MPKNNLLLGNGQALVGPTDWPSNSRPKKNVYTVEEARTHLHPQLELFASEAARIPVGAAPRGEVVGKVVVHPEYLAKSHYPVRVLLTAGLRVVGTRSQEINPRRRLRVRDADHRMLTAEILVAGTIEKFGNLDRLLMNGQRVGVQRDFCRIEDIGFMSPDDRIRNLHPLSDGSLLLETVLHAERDDDDIVSKFSEWVMECGGSTNLQLTINIDGLTFVPVWLPSNAVEKLAIFSHLRVMRSAVPLRSMNGALRGGSLLPPSLPVFPPMNDNIRVAVFDGGLDASALEPHAFEHIWPETAVTTDEFLDHGALVTSALLFGPVVPGQPQLPQPYAAVDHFRVATVRDEKDPVMFDAIRRICEVLDRGRHQFANISLAPAQPIEDNDVHLWTSALEKRIATKRMMLSVAVGNNGDLDFPESRIQVPADLVNAVAVGAASTPAGGLIRWEKSCIGPGRSPGLVKPDGVSWGEMVPLYNPRSGNLVFLNGTSFAAPLALRSAVGAAALADGVSAAIARALLIHTTERPSRVQREEVGHGRFALDPFDLITCGDREAMVVYEGMLMPGTPVGARLPWPEEVVHGNVKIRATLLFYTPVDIAHPINYTRAGIEGRLRRSPGGNTISFFSRRRLYKNTEQQLRSDAHKWETVVSKEIGAQANTINDPMLELVYRARDEGMAVNNATLDPLPYVLVVTVAALSEPEFYDRVRRRYPVLTPVRLRTGVSLSI